LWLYIFPLKRTWSIEYTLEFLAVCIKCTWNWTAGSRDWRRFSQIFSNINTCKNGFPLPYCGSIWPPEIMTWTNLNLHYVKKRSCKAELFWHFGSWEELWLLNDPTLFLHFYDNLPFEEDLVFYLKKKLEFPLSNNDLNQVLMKLLS
jgi:hypothetical protein